MKTVVSLIAKIRTVKGPNEADKGVYNYFFDGEKYGVEEPASGEGRRYAGPFTLRAQSVLIGNSLTTLFGFESAAPSGGELMYLNNPASNIGTENPYLAVVYHKDHLGSTRAITKVDGTILEQNDYYPFGLRTTRGENYSTLSESLAAIAQNANNTSANTVVPEYLYNGKEKQNFMKNTSAVINAGGSTDYTSNYIDYGARFYNPTTLRWNTQDPMAEKYQRYSPYNYCVNNPISLVDPNGEDNYRFDRKTGTFHLVEPTKDDFDQVLDYSYNKKTKTYEAKTDNKGNTITKIKNVEKGILADKINFKTEDHVISVGGEGQPTVEGVESFVTQLSNLIKIEIGGAYFSTDGTEATTHITLGKYVNNRYNKTTTHGQMAWAKKYFPSSVNEHLTGFFHTHPSGGDISDDLRMIPSRTDFDSRDATLRNYPHVRFIMLTPPNNSGGKYPFRKDYTTMPRPFDW